MSTSKKKTSVVHKQPVPPQGWQMGQPPESEMVAMVCRKWFAMHDGRYIEVISGDPKRYLESQSLKIMMEPTVTVIYGRIFMEGEFPFVLDERGSPVAVYPNSILAWTYVPDTLLDLQAVTLTDMAVRVAKKCTPGR
ncbi:MAG: hypothetical protein EON54_05490 [Alcaligenaceae bacterium]|nr:MAG: hypothetical protein EON54_05490 [Alcaligenaceae bacterium]